jgi:hypothetical protein
MQCSSEKPAEALQLEAMERAVASFASQVSESQEKLARTRKNLNDETLDRASFEALLKNRWLEERVLARVTEEHQRARKTLEELAHSSRSHDSMRGNDLSAFNRAMLHQSIQVSKSDANLALFLQKSPTLRPLRMERHFGNTQPRGSSTDSKPTRRTRKRSLKLRQSANDRRRCFVTESRACRLLPCDNPAKGPNIAHSGMMPSYERKLSVCSSITPTLRMSSELDDLSATGHTSHTDLTAILPTSVIPRSGGHDTLPLCDEVAQSKRSKYTNNSVHPQTCILNSNTCDEPEPTFGSIAIWRTHPRIAPSLRSRSRLQVLEDVPVPTYAQSLMDSFVQRKIPSLHLTQPSIQTNETELGRAPTSLQNTPPPAHDRNASRNAVVETILDETPRRARAVVERKRRSIFSLHLPKRSTDSSPPLEAELSAIPEDRADVPQTPRRSRLRKELPSTQAYDLSQLDAAPDDIPPHGVPSTRPHLLMKNERGDTASSLRALERSSKRSSVLAPISALKRVGSRISMLSRR